MVSGVGSASRRIPGRCADCVTTGETKRAETMGVPARFSLPTKVSQPSSFTQAAFLAEERTQASTNRTPASPSPIPGTRLARSSPC